jgi:UDP-N-acetylglucosamine--N-acetylmuramyl-(pentapeptide) pyrophosphoryl-undecaprenol N-acetylglucosamine transferase
MARGGGRILFAGGGTGGHVFPGVALAQHAIDCKVFWLCTARPFDAAQLSREGIPFEALESPRWSGFAGFLAPMARALLAADRRLRRFRPHVVVGVGGYGTVPPVVSAAARGIPYVLLEQNVRPGKANRFLAPGAARIFAQWPQARAAFPGCGGKVAVTGSPLRAHLRRVPRDQALRRFGLRDGTPTLAVVGGSQGAEALNRGVVAGLDGAVRRIQVIHVAGTGRAESVRKAYAERGARAVVCEFVSDMDHLYSAADLVVSRAGALAIEELSAFQVPAVLVPLPSSAGDHQRENARAAARSGGAILIEESECASGLGPILLKLAAGDPLFEAMRRKIGTHARPDSARIILEDLRRFFGP